MLNPQRNASSSKRKFEIGITTFTLFLCVLGLTGMSITSFFQTQSAFEPLNDPTMGFQGIQFGMWIAFLSALIFQYGQNAALYVKNTYATGKTVINLFGIWNIKDTTLCWIVFWLCAAIDAGTNCLWLYNQPDIRKQHPVFQTIEYSSMILIVFVEEVLGIVLQALAHSFTLFRQILASENSIVAKKNSEYKNYDDKNKPQKSHQVPQQPYKQSEKPSQGRMSIKDIQKTSDDNDWLKTAKQEHEHWQKPDFYRTMDDSEEFPQ